MAVVPLLVADSAQILPALQLVEFSEVSGIRSVYCEFCMYGLSKVVVMSLFVVLPQFPYLSTVLPI